MEVRLRWVWSRGGCGGVRWRCERNRQGRRQVRRLEDWGEHIQSWCDGGLQEAFIQETDVILRGGKKKLKRVLVSVR